MSQKPGRNDPCWCGSGKKFKKCHLLRFAASPLPLAAVEDAARRAWSHKQCLHPLAAPGVCRKIVAAHTIQRAAVLAKIVDEKNHVRTFYAPNATDSEPDSIGWHRASTFTGFCAAHDGPTFAPIETSPFIGGDEQCFLIGYRALCHEVYQKRGSLRTGPVLSELVDRGRPVEIQAEIQHQLAVADAGVRAGLAGFEAIKRGMDQQLLARQYSGWSRLLIRFRGEICLASTGAVTPNRDLSGVELQTLHNPTAHLEALLLGVAATDDGGVVVLTWPSRQAAPRRFVESLLERSHATLSDLLVQFMFAYVENTFFSDRWWRSLSRDSRRHLAALARMGNPYYTDFPYLTAPLVPWDVDPVAIEDVTE